jgi:CHAT domain-containing protein/Tfp pilus assembly protein PilF
MKHRIKARTFLLWVVFLSLSIVTTSPLRAQRVASEKEKEIFSRAMQAMKSGSYDTAMNLLYEVLQIRSETDGVNSVPVANILTNLGVAKSGLYLYDSAITFYEKSLSIYEAAGNAELRHLASVYHNLGICFNAKGDIEKAKAYYENADRIFQKLDMVGQNVYEILLMNMTDYYLEHKNIQEAEKYNKKSFAINPKSPHCFKKWSSSGMIAGAKKDFAKSISDLNKAIVVGEKDLGVNFAEKGLIYLNLGTIYLEMEDFDHSLANYQIARDLIEKRIGKQSTPYTNCLKDMGLIYLRMKEKENNLEKFMVQRERNIGTALDYFQEAIIAITPGFTSRDRSSNPEPENAMDKIRLLDVLKSKAEALFLLAQLEERQENKEAYISHLKLALATFDLSIKTIHLIRNGFQSQESRLFLSENEHPVYSEAVEVAVSLYEKTGDPLYFEKGFEFSERSRSANFQSMLRELKAKEFSGLPDSLLQKETEMKGEIAAYQSFIFNEKSTPVPDQTKINLWNDKVFALTQGYQQMISLIEKNYPRYYQYKYADPIVSVQKVQQSLDRREAVIEYFLNDSHHNSNNELYTFVITDNEFKIIRKSLDRNFDQTVDQFLQFIKNGLVLATHKADYIRYSKNASDLYKLLVEPVVPTMQNYRLVIVPDDKLSYLPFDAFLASGADTTKMDFRNLDYLVHHHAISYTYSATLLYYYFDSAFKYSNRTAAFAPEYNSSTNLPGTSVENFLPLPGAEAEAIGVTDLIKGDRYLGSKATKQAFKDNAEKYDILHLAMHTILNDTLPLYSKMVFSSDGTPANDRTLNTSEIYNLKLKSDMVVLSGCNTGSGKLQKGEGVMSLARAFLFAGCPSIIMTLWNVEDVSSSYMMIEFYKNIKNGYSKDEALKRAKISYISIADPMKAHPYFWLGYVSIGKQSPLFKSKAGYFVGLIIFVFLAIVLEKWYFKRKKRISRLK